MFSLIYNFYYLKLKPESLDKWFVLFIVRISNLVLPTYFRLTAPFFSLKESKIVKDEKDLYIVSLTTFPSRIDKVWLTIETIFRQSVKPDAIILWLYEGEFNGKASLPKNLLAQEKRGLQIRFCQQNLMPHKKYYFSMQSHPNATIITIDDDIFYATSMLKKLIKASQKYPKTICCCIARKIALENNQLKKYDDWYYTFSNEEPSFHLLPIGVGGVLYPPKSIHSEAFDIDALSLLSLRADDLWLKVMSALNKVSVVAISGEFKRYPMPITQKNNVSLMTENVDLGKNDLIISNLLSSYDLNPKVFERNLQIEVTNNKI